MAELRENNHNVYIHVSDADAKMVKTASDVNFEVDTDTEESATGLFSRYDKLIKEHLFKNQSISYPDMVSGGYKFTLPASEEEGTVEASTIRAQQLDEKVRAALVQAYLKRQGVDGKRIKTASKGHDMPLAGKAATDDTNKRISIVVR